MTTNRSLAETSAETVLTGLGLPQRANSSERVIPGGEDYPSGDAAWERHPNGDEIVQIVEGATTLHIITEDGPQSFALKAGMVAIVPQNTWHRFHAPNGVSIITATPRPTEHLTVDVEDPRTLSNAERAANSEEKVR